MFFITIAEVKIHMLILKNEAFYLGLLKVHIYFSFLLIKGSTLEKFIFTRQVIN